MESEEKIKDEKKEKKQEEKKTRDSAVIRTTLPVSMKQSMSIINFIKGKSVGDALEMLEKVIKMKIAVPMKGEIPHRKGIGSGRYPIKAAEMFIKLLKGISSNASHLGVEGNLVIRGKANIAPRSMRPGRFRHKFKRVHVELRLEKK
jgi:large subunit ribosomal protein L22